MSYDAIIIGSGPNGLAAAITLQRHGLQTLVIEGNATPGGGVRTKALTLPGFQHDICSAIHPMAASSPFFKQLPLEDHGLQWITPPVAVAHPFDNGSAASLHNSFEKTARELAEDESNYRNLMQHFLSGWDQLAEDILGPIRFPKKTAAFLRFGLNALQPAEFLARQRFSTRKAQALFAGLAGHAMLPLNWSGSSAIGLVLGTLAHITGWPFPKGGAQKITTSLTAYYESLGGKIQTGWWVKNYAELPKARVCLFDTSPAQLVQIAGKELTRIYKRRLMNFRYGPGIFKMDFALSEPIPWKAKACSSSATVHLGGTLEEIAAAERSVYRGHHPEKPFTILAQPSIFDETRAPTGKHTCWCYCHTPNGSEKDLTATIENQIERFAPGFKDLIIGRHTINSNEMQTYNPNYRGGDINGGRQNLLQTFSRPIFSLDPYATSNRQIFLCSASTPPGGGVHGMSGYHAAGSVLKKVYNVNLSKDSSN